jgi:hypothetical protein
MNTTAYFDSGNRLSQDCCTLLVRDNENSGVSSYTLTDMRAGRGSGSKRASFAATARQHCNLRPWDGYGISANAVDDDSRLRNESAVTHTRERIQLPKRVFTAVPNLANGKSAPDAESTMVLGSLDTTLHRPPGRLAERGWDRFDPVLRHQPVQVEHVVVPVTWTRGGVPSREVARSDAFLSAIGYVNDGKAWHRQQQVRAN